MLSTRDPPRKEGINIEDKLTVTKWGREGWDEWGEWD